MCLELGLGDRGCNILELLRNWYINKQQFLVNIVFTNPVACPKN